MSDNNSLEPTKFKQAYMELLKSKVKFPQKNIYFQKKPDNVSQSKSKSQSSNSNNLNKPSGTKNATNQNINNNKPEENKQNKESFDNRNNEIPSRPEKPQITPSKKPDLKPSNNDKLVKEAKESLESVKNTISLLLEADEQGKF